jgi:tripartite-type tricarboxylate transporter receptor subunit TctC
MRQRKKTQYGAPTKQNARNHRGNCLMLTRRHVLALSTAALCAPHVARAEAAWPSRGVRYSLGFAAGGATDTLSRIFCAKMSELTGQQFTVENRGGAGGVIGADAIAKSAPDGYTLGMGSIATNAIAVGTYAKLPFQAGADFAFISGLWQLPNVLVVRNDLPAKDIGELLALAKKEPGKLTYASPGIGTTLHLSGEMMKSMGGVDLQHVTYKGGAPAMVDLLAGRVDTLFDNLPGSLSAIRAGSVRALAVTTKARSPAVPDVPAMGEVLPGYDLTSWTALCGPAKLPSDIVQTANALSRKALADPVVMQKFAELGAVAWPTSAEEITAFRDSEEKRLLPIIKAAGIVPA